MSVPRLELRLESPAPRATSPRTRTPGTGRTPRSVRNSPALGKRVWQASPGSAVIPARTRVIVDLPANSPPPRQLSDGTCEVTVGDTGLVVDDVIRGEDDNDTIDKAVYSLAERCAEGFNTSLTIASADAVVGCSSLLDSDNGPQAATMLISYALDFFSHDPVAMDVCAVRISCAEAAVYDLLARDDDGEPLLLTAPMHYRAKWGLSGAASTHAINGVGDLAILPTLLDVAPGLISDPTSLVALQVRLRRPQTVTMPSFTGELDVVQHMTLLSMPTALWQALPPRGPAEEDTSATLHAVVAALNVGLSIGGDDDSRAIECERVVTSLLRACWFGNAAASIVVAAASGDIVDHAPALAGALRVRDASPRVIRAAFAAEAQALSDLQRERDESVGAIRRLVKLLPDACVLWDVKELVAVEASEAARAAFVLDDGTVGATSLSDGSVIPVEHWMPGRTLKGARGIEFTVLRVERATDGLMIISATVAADTTPKLPPAPMPAGLERAASEPREERPRAKAPREVKRANTEASCGCVVA